MITKSGGMKLQVLKRNVNLNQLVLESENNVARTTKFEFPKISEAAVLDSKRDSGTDKNVLSSFVYCLDLVRFVNSKKFELKLETRLAKEYLSILSQQKLITFDLDISVTEVPFYHDFYAYLYFFVSITKDTSRVINI